MGRGNYATDEEARGQLGVVLYATVTAAAVFATCWGVMGPEIEQV